MLKSIYYLLPALVLILGCGGESEQAKDGKAPVKGSERDPVEKAVREIISNLLRVEVRDIYMN